MFVLDTNSISETRKKDPDPSFSAWLFRTDWRDLYLSAATVYELEIGVLAKERSDPIQGRALRTWLTCIIREEFAGRILSVDLRVAVRSAALQVPDRRNVVDAMIAATAYIHGMSVVTRNVRDFQNAGVPVVNPWELKTPPTAPA
jgi:predicted nucleic acid-binding protein